MIIADTSVLIKLVLAEPRSDLARQLRSDDLASPTIWLAEAANVLWRKVRTNEIAQSHARQALRILEGTIQTIPIEGLAKDALDLAVELNHPVYDCFFLQSAIQQNSYVITDDRRFAHAVRTHKKWSAHLRLLIEA
jgi:predicted nucleic acid-binding protein